MDAEVVPVDQDLDSAKEGILGRTNGDGEQKWSSSNPEF